MTYLPSYIHLERVIVKQHNVGVTLGGTIDSSKQYFIDGELDLTGVSIEIPSGGMTITGMGFDISKLTCSDNSYTMFTSPVAGSGDLLITDTAIEVTGTNSKVFELIDIDGTHAVELNRVNFNGCTSLGSLEDYRQGLEMGTGRFGGTPELTLHGDWGGGYRITTSIVRGLTDNVTFSLFSAGTLFVMNSRFLTDINCDLPNNGILLDFSDTNFPNTSTLELRDCIITRSGLTVPNDLAITPNISASNLSCSWRGNNGVPNTFVGGIATITTEVETIITESTNPTVLLGTVTNSDMQHFDSPANGQLRHLGNNPREYTVNFDFILEGAQNRDYAIQLIKNDGSDSQVYQQIRVVNNLSGGRDVAYFTGMANVILNKNEYLFWQVENLSNNANCTLELDSSWSCAER